MTITHLTVLQFYIIALIDSDRHIGVDPHEVKTTINKGDLFVWLDTRFPNQVDTSLYVDSQAQVGEEVLQRSAWPLMDTSIATRVSNTTDFVCSPH